jgi:hypothetical protein
MVEALKALSSLWLRRGLVEAFKSWWRACRSVQGLVESFKALWRSSKHDETLKALSKSSKPDGGFPAVVFTVLSVFTVLCSMDPM